MPSTTKSRARDTHHEESKILARNIFPKVSKCENVFSKQENVDIHGDFYFLSFVRNLLLFKRIFSKQEESSCQSQYFLIKLFSFQCFPVNRKRKYFHRTNFLVFMKVSSCVLDQENASQI